MLCEIIFEFKENNMEKTNDIIIQTVDKLLEMEPDPIPKFILLRDFKNISKTSTEYKKLYKEVLSSQFVKDIENSQEKLGYWGAFHGDTEAIIRRCLALGLENDHQCLRKVKSFIMNVLRKKDFWHQRFEKQDNPKWWTDMFMPLVSASMLSLIDNKNPLLEEYKDIWLNFAEKAFMNGVYNKTDEAIAQYNFFKIKTKRSIPFYNYYSILLLTSDEKFIPKHLDKLMVDYCINDENGMYYVYDHKPLIKKSIKDHAQFCYWLRCHSILSRFNNYQKYRNDNILWLLNEKNESGLWKIDKKVKLQMFPLSNSWRKEKNKIIDSTIFILKYIKGINGN